MSTSAAPPCASGVSGELPYVTAETPSSAMPALEMAELRVAMQQHLRRSGALKCLKTQLRGMVLTNLMKAQRGAAASPHHRGAGEGQASGDMSLEQLEKYRRNGGTSGAQTGEAENGEIFASWSGRVADALIENHLRRTRRPMSLSIFSTEAEVPPLSDTGAPSEEEQYLRQLFAVKAESVNAGAEALGDEFDMSLDGGVTASSVRSVLQTLVEGQLLTGSQRHAGTGHRHNCGVQTDDTSKKDETNPLTSLECRLAAVDAKYALTFSQLKHGDGTSIFTRAEVERRLEQYKQDIHEQLRREYQQKYKTFEQTKLHEAKDVAEERYKAMAQHKQEELRELERSLIAQREQDQQRLRLAREEVEKQRISLEQRQRDAVKWEQEQEARIQQHEEAQRSLKQKISTMQLQCAKWEELCGSRLMEAEEARSRESRRVEELRRMQAEHATELRLKEEELSRLRFRIRMLVNSAPNGAPGSANAGNEGDPSSLPNQLYQVLVRTEELSRNAVQQQHNLQQQQQVLFRQSLPSQQQQQLPPASFSAQQPSQVSPDTVNVNSSGSNAFARPTPQRIPPPAVSVSVPAEDSQRKKWDAAWSTSAHKTTTFTPDSASPLTPLRVPAEKSKTSVSKEDMQSVSSLPKSSSSPPPAPVVTATRVGSDRDGASDTGASSKHGSPLLGEVAKLLSTNASPQEGSLLSQRSGSVSLLAIAAKVLKPAAAPDSAFSSSSSTTSSSSHTHSHSNSNEKDEHLQPGESTQEGGNPNTADKYSKTTSSTASNASAKLQRERDQVLHEEESARANVVEEEITARGGIAWSYNSQKTVLESQERERAQDINGGTRLRIFDQMEATRQQQQLETANIIHQDDTDDDDSILFGKSGSTGSSW